MRIPVFYILILLLLGLLIQADMPLQPIVILAPALPDSISYDQGKLLIVSTSKEIGTQLLLSTEWSSQKLFDFSSGDLKNNFAKEFYKIVPSQATLERFVYMLKLFNGYSQPETLAFSYQDSFTIRKLWQHPKFTQLAKDIQKTNVSNLLVTVQGWKDTTYDAVYDDPNNDGRTLYKMHVKLIPGNNNIYCSPVGKKNAALLYQTTFIMESKPTADRAIRFHGSTLEQSCTTCHEGLPGAGDTTSMKADCSVCHKSMTSGMYVHAPAEMKECTTCHSWSKKNNAVVVEQGVPTTCYTCHDAKQKQVESSPSMHPVAGDCIMCHSPHGTQQKHIVKEDVYTLCTTCHEEQQVNHPVGRHPLRFTKLSATEEISCVTCHNPHGSEYESLLRSPGGRMGICEACH